MRKLSLQKILIVDDDELIVNLIEQYFKLEGFETITCQDGLAALKLAESEKPDLIILDVMLPKLDGFHVCKKLQGSGIPIILLTAKSDITDKLVGLEAGADDYVVKPFDSRELVARARTIFRRLQKVSEKIEGQMENGDREKPGIIMNKDYRTVFINGTELELTPTEFDLLYHLTRHPGRVFDRQQLLEAVWGYNFLGDSRTVDIHIQRLRKKLKDYAGSIETVFGVGYRFRELEK
jgi:DNA-binding response OmpR family regulator